MKAERGLLSVGLESPFLPRMLSTVAALSSEDTDPGENAAPGTAARGHPCREQQHPSVCMCRLCLLAQGTQNVVPALLSPRAISLSPLNVLCSTAVIRNHLYTHWLSWQDPRGSGSLMTQLDT